MEAINSVFKAHLCQVVTSAGLFLLCLNHTIDVGASITSTGAELGRCSCRWHSNNEERSSPRWHGDGRQPRVVSAVPCSCFTLRKQQFLHGSCRASSMSEQLWFCCETHSEPNLHLHQAGVDVLLLLHSCSQSLQHLKPWQDVTFSRYVPGEHLVYSSYREREMSLNHELAVKKQNAVWDKVSIGC